MAIEDLIGEPLSFGPVEVTPDAVAAFAAGVNQPPDRASPFHVATVVIPGSGSVVLDPRAEVDVGRIVHGGVGIRFLRGVATGSALTATSALDRVDVKDSGRIIHVRFSVTDEEGEVAEGMTAYFERGRSKGERREETRPSGDFEIVAHTRPDQSLLYAEGSGDRFPIHTDDDFARSVGLPGKIMHGMCTLALSTAAILEEVGGQPGVVSCRFTNIVRPGQDLDIVGRRVGEDQIAFETWSSGRRAITEGRLTMKNVLSEESS